MGYYDVSGTWHNEDPTPAYQNTFGPNPTPGGPTLYGDSPAAPGSYQPGTTLPNPDPMQDPYQYDPVSNPGGTGVGLPVGGGSTGVPTAPDPNPTSPTDPNAPTTTTTPTTTTPTNNPTPGSGQFTGVFTPPNAIPLPTLPTYTPPPAFAAPSVAEAMQDPGLQFRMQQGEDALQRWAAANGTLNDSGTAKSLIDYGQNAAEQGYADVFNRDYQTYNTNTQTQYRDPFQFQLSAYNAAAPNILHQNDMNYQEAWQSFLNDENMWQFNVNNNLAG